MRVKSRLLATSVALGLWTLATSADAGSEIAGIKLGDSRESVLRNLGPGTSTALLSDGWGNELLWNGSGLDVQLCDGIVAAVSRQMPGGFHEFSRLAIAQQRTRGSASFSSLNALSASGENSTISAEWHEGAETYRLALWVKNQEAPRISEQVHTDRPCASGQSR
jgi:hypothetical protein